MAGIVFVDFPVIVELEKEKSKDKIETPDLTSGQRTNKVNDDCNFNDFDYL